MEYITGEYYWMLNEMRFFGVRLIISSVYAFWVVILTSLFISITEYAVVDLRVLRRNAASKKYQGLN